VLPSRGGARLAPRVLNKEGSGSDYDPGNECEHARKQQNFEDESGHGTLPITQDLLSRRRV
jgi:hypothetical protein